MLSKRNILIFGLVAVIPTVIGMYISSFMFLGFIAEIPVFAAVFLILSFFIKSNKIKIIITVPIALIIPLWGWTSTIIAGHFG